MSWIKEIREKLGLSQYRLAQYLKVSRSLIYFAEKGMRSLSTEAMIKLQQLSEIWDKALEEVKAGKVVSLGKEYEDAAQKQRQKTIELYKKKVDRYKHKVLVLQKRLEKMKKNYQQSVSQLELTGTLFNDLIDAPEEKRERLWLEIEQSEAFSRFTDSGKLNQFMLNHEIEILTGRINMHEDFLRKMTK